LNIGFLLQLQRHGPLKRAKINLMEESHSQLSAKFHDLEQLWNPADVAASEAAYRALLLEGQKLTGRERSYLIELYSLIARTEAYQEKYAEARSTLEAAEVLLEEQQSFYLVSAKIRWLIEYGRLHILAKTPSQAKKFFSEAWTLSINSAEDYFAVEIAQLLAATEPQKTQQAWITRAIEIAESSPLPKSKKWLGGLYTSLGWKFYDLRQFENALEGFQKSLRHHKAHGSPREQFVAQWSIGKVLRTQGKTEEALSIQQALLAELGIGGARDGRLYEELAECLQTLKRTTEAQLYFELAYRELSADEWIQDNQPVKLKRMKDLGKVK
jgi:tetratricopeptide (TPR) repeat protein